MNDFDYRVMRNPETLASYRSWRRATARKGRVFIALAAPLLVWGGVLIGQALIGWRGLPLGYGPALLSLAGGLLAYGSFRIQLYRRRHPWVDPADA